MKLLRVVGIILGLGVAIGMSSLVLADSIGNAIGMKITAMESVSEVINKATVPTTPEPTWLQRQKALRTVTYTVATKGVITADLAEFKTDVNETLNDSRGWSALGVRFEEVASGGMLMLVLSQASELPSFSPICDVLYSCTVGNTVIINQDRWLGATTPWNQAGLSLRDYRNLVVNHETGHWLGHPDANTCSGAGQPALVMTQQSISRGECTFNPWPLAVELWSTRLGISR